MVQKFLKKINVNEKNFRNKFIGFNTSALIIINGKIVGAIEEERLNREKRTRKFPNYSIKYLLEKKFHFKDIDDIGISWNPMLNLKNIKKIFMILYIPEILFSTLANFSVLIKHGKDEVISPKQ